MTERGKCIGQRYARQAGAAGERTHCMRRRSGVTHLHHTSWNCHRRDANTATKRTVQHLGDAGRDDDVSAAARARRVGAVHTARNRSRLHARLSARLSARLRGRLRARLYAWLCTG